MNFMKHKPFLALTLMAIVGSSVITGCAQNTSPNEDVEINLENGTADSDIPEDTSDLIDLTGLEEAQSETINLSEYSNGINISKAGTYSINGESKNPLVVDAENEEITLKLNGVKISTTGLPAIYVKKAQSVTLEVENENSLSNTGDLTHPTLDGTLHARGDLFVEGNGNLTISSETANGIRSKSSYNQSSATVSIEAAKIGIKEDGFLNMDDGTLSITKAEDAGIVSNELVQVTGGTVDIKNTSYGIYAAEIIGFSSGTTSIEAKEAGLYTDGYAGFEGGEISITSENNGVVSKNSTYIGEGKVEISAKNNNVAGTEEQNGTYSTGALCVAGGNFLSLSEKGMTPYLIDQPGVALPVTDFQSISVEQNGKKILEAQAPDAFKGKSGTLFLSIAGLQEGSEATITVNGESQTVQIQEELTKIGDPSMTTSTYNPINMEEDDSYGSFEISESDASDEVAYSYDEQLNEGNEDSFSSDEDLLDTYNLEDYFNEYQLEDANGFDSQEEIPEVSV